MAVNLVPWVVIVACVQAMANDEPWPDLLAAESDAPRLTSSDAALVAAFDWARTTALRHVGADTDPVGPWYEAALPGREAFCMRDVSHQCLGAEVLGLARHNLNMMTRFAEGIAESRDFCSFWEINRHNLPAPVDYASDDDFWYNLPANFDLLDACYRLYQWTGNRAYLEGAAFDRFYRLTMTEYLDRWQLRPATVMHRPGMPNLRPTASRFAKSRGIPSYDEGQGELRLGSDLLGVMACACRAYASMLTARGRADEAGPYRLLATDYQRLLDTTWWDEAQGAYYAFNTVDGRFYHGGVANSEFLLWYQAIEQPARIRRALSDIRNTQVEVLSYLPSLGWRYGQEDDAYRWLMLLPADARRDYPEASYAAVEAITTGMMGIEPSATEGLIRTCPRLARQTAWAAIEHVPVLGGLVSVGHRSNLATCFANKGDRPVVWRAMFRGAADTLLVDGQARAASRWVDAIGNEHAYVDVRVPGRAQSRAERPAK